MGEGRAGRVGGPKGGGVGGAEAVKQGGDVACICDFCREVFPEGGALCRVREVA